MNACPLTEYFFLPGPASVGPLMDDFLSRCGAAGCAGAADCAAAPPAVAVGTVLEASTLSAPSAAAIRIQSSGQTLKIRNSNGRKECMRKHTRLRVKRHRSEEASDAAFTWYASMA